MKQCEYQGQVGEDERLVEVEGKQLVYYKREGRMWKFVEMGSDVHQKQHDGRCKPFLQMYLDIYTHCGSECSQEICKVWTC